MPLRRVATPAGLLLALTLAVKLVAVTQLGGHPLLQPAGGLDSEHYVALAARVASGDFLLGPGAYYLSPLYIYFLGGVLWGTGSLQAARVLQALLGTAAVGFVYLAARRLYGRRPALVALALAAATGLFTFYEVLLIQAALDPFLVGLAAFAVARAAGREEGGPATARGDGWRRWWLAGLALGLLSLNRPNALPMALGLALLPILWRGEGRPQRGSNTGRRGWLAGAALAGGVALAIAPVTLRNLAITGEPVLITSHGGLNFYIGNNPEADGTYHEVPGITPSIAGQAADMRRVAERDLGRTLSDGEVSDYFYGRGLAWVRERPAAAAKLWLRKVGYTFHAAFLPLTHSYPYYVHDETSILRVLVVGAWLIVPLGLFGLAAVPRRTGSWWAIALMVALYGLSVSAFFVSSRYRVPLLVLLCIPSGAAVDWWLGRRKASVKTTAAAGAALLALAAAVNWPLALDDGRFEERARMAVTLVADGNLGRAEELVSRADESHPSAGLMRYRVGLAYAARGDFEAARRHYEHALRLDPGQAEIQLSLGQALLESGRFGEAAVQLRAALEKGVRPGAARASLARALEQQGLERALAGDPRGAAGPLESARQVAPREPSILLNLAVVYAQLGRDDDARALAREALAIRPDYDQARRFLHDLR